MNRPTDADLARDYAEWEKRYEMTKDIRSEYAANDYLQQQRTVRPTWMTPAPYRTRPAPARRRSDRGLMLAAVGLIIAVISTLYTILA